MRSFLCTEFLDFAAGLYGTSTEALGAPVCDPASCPGLEHVRAWAELVAGPSGVSSAILLQRFGAALFGRLVRGYPVFLVGIESTLDLVSRYEAHIVAEVRKLNRAARLPHIGVRRRPGEPVEVVYRSSRGLADLAEGLLIGSIAHFGDPLDIERSATADRGSDCAVFRLLPRDAR
jgi:hypothetical protein